MKAEMRSRNPVRVSPVYPAAAHHAGGEQAKQVALMSATRVPVNKEFLLQGGGLLLLGQYGDLGQEDEGRRVRRFHEQGEGLGIPLPRGVIR